MLIKMILSEQFILRTEPDGTGIISHNEAIYNINELCVLILQNLNEKQDLKSIINTITHEYDVSTEDLQIDLDNFFSQLMSFKIISPQYYNTLKRGLNELSK